MDHTTVGKIRVSLVDSTSEPAAKTYTNKHGQTATMNTENIARPASLLNFRCLAAFDLLKP